MSGFLHLRADRGPLSAPVTATIYEGRVARLHAPGDALMYSSGPEHRDEVELTNIVNQLVGLPVYLGHPAIFPAKDSGQKIVGTVESGRLDEDTAVGRLGITDEEALAAIKSGTYELSLGYACLIDGDRYQRNIKLDHLAIVDRARCGPSCSMRTDMLETLPIEAEEAPVKVGTAEVEVNIVISDETRKLLETLASVNSEGVHTNADGQVEKPVEPCACNNRAIHHNMGETMSDTSNKDELATMTAELAALKAKVTELEVEATNARKDADAATAKLNDALAAADKAKADADTAVAQAKSDAADALNTEVAARVDARVEVLTEAARFDLKDAEGNKLDVSKLDNRAIKCAVIKHVDGDEVPAEKSNDFVDGVYRGSLKRGADASGSREAVRVAVNQMRVDAAAGQAKTSGRAGEEAAKANMKRESELAWTKTNA